MDSSGHRGGSAALGWKGGGTCVVGTEGGR